jgi:hypothetical protein
MTETTQRAECELSDGSRLEIAWTPAANAKAPALDVAKLATLVSRRCCA